MSNPQYGGEAAVGKDEERAPGNTASHDQQQGDLQDGDSRRELPEGLKTERHGPLNKSSGRRAPK